MNQAQAKAALLAVAGALLETVQAAGPQGAPAGPMYAAVMAHGIGLDTFNRIMSALEASGRVRKRGHCYFAADAA